jgi:hypothetical protein
VKGARILKVRIGEDMATDRQIAYYKSLCRQLGQEPEDDFENLDTYEASQAIDELKYLLEEREGIKRG